MKNKIYLPHIDYPYLPVCKIIKSMTKSEIIASSIEIKDALEIGTKYSFKETNLLFKYDLGNCIAALEKGTNIILEGFSHFKSNYSMELEKEILETLGYTFKYINIKKNNHVSVVKLYQFAKQINNKLNILKYIYYLVKLVLIIFIIDKINNSKQAEHIKERTIKNLNQENISIYKIIKEYYFYSKKYKNELVTKKNKKKLLLIGTPDIIMNSKFIAFVDNIKNVFTILKPYMLAPLILNYNLKQKKYLIKSKKYLKYSIGSTGTESVYYTLYYSKKNIAGIIYFQNNSNTAELSAIPIIKEICKDNKIPIINLNYNNTDDLTNNDIKLKSLFKNK